MNDNDYKTKEFINQVLSEIKYYLNPKPEECETREFLMGMLCGLHAALDSQPAYVTNKRFLETIVYVGLKSKKYCK